MLLKLNCDISTLCRAMGTLSGVALFSFGCRQVLSEESDFSKTNVVLLVFDGTNAVSGHGLRHAYWERDGLTTFTTIDDIPCRRLHLADSDFGFFYFAIDPTFKKRSPKNVIIDIEFYDQGFGRLGLQYDASRAREHPNSAYTMLDRFEWLNDSHQWRIASFRVQNASFEGAQNSGSDFRFLISPPDLYVRRVSVTRGK